MTERAPTAEQPLVEEAVATPWAQARDRLANPERARTYWLATVRPDGRPHVMPIIGIWLDDAFYFITGEATRKGKNLASDPHCVIATSNTAVPSLDVILEGEARRVDDESKLRRVADAYGSKMEWPLEVRDGGVFGPNAPTAGPPPYAVFELTPTTACGLPGVAGMERAGSSGFVPTRWRF
jgi:nitroimidazol reductase NimA-like FMN-containing flavoprotein (pyridoxamine 5'-phosphate oxidase superfamily)